ncbi:MAG: PKD domain-containing protein, partial [Caldilineaceae bacterium]|nr:PKD domain-containing protein [Caldilineaceae bacterium]
TGAQAEAECSAPYLVTQSFANGARWQLCWEQRNLDGILLRKVYFTPPGGIQTQVLAMASISQVHVPYDDNSARFHDITDDGFGNENLNDLTPAECPGGALLRDGSKDVICQQIQLRGHATKGLGVQEQGEWLSLFSVSTSGEYNYIPVWRFLDDGSIEMIMGATGKLQRFTTSNSFGWPVRADGTLGTSHIHNYYWRLDFDLGEKAEDDLVEEFNYALEAGAAAPRRVLGVTPLTTESGRSIARQSMRSWRIRDGMLTNGQGRAISYQLEPMTVNHRDVGPANEPWTANDFYVTKFNACEKYVSHNPQINGCGNNLADFVNGESLTDADLVLWYGVTFHHIPRDEDEPYMEAHWDGFRIAPRDWTAANPLAVNAPPTAAFSATPLSGAAPLTVSFDATAASDTDGQISAYQWAFGDGATATGQTTSHTFTQTGDFTVTLTVVDDAGGQDAASTTITVAAAACQAGDVNCDGMVDAADALFIMQYDVKLRTASQTAPPPAGTLYAPACDVSGDDACNAADALLVLQCTVGITNRYCSAAHSASNPIDTNQSETENGPVDAQSAPPIFLPVVEQ